LAQLRLLRAAAKRLHATRALIDMEASTVAFAASQHKDNVRFLEKMRRQLGEMAE